MADDISFEAWLQIGLEQKWCGPPICHTHDGLPTSEEEDALWEEEDPCIHILRLYSDSDLAALVEANHPPSVWRKPRGPRPR